MLARVAALARIVRLVVLSLAAAAGAVTCNRLYGGVLLTVAAAGVFLSVVAEVGLRVFSSAPVVAAVSAALGCRDWRRGAPRLVSRGVGGLAVDGARGRLPELPRWLALG